MKLGSKLRSLRLSKRMTIKEVAGRIKVAPSTYRDWEYGRKVSAEKLGMLSDLFEISTPELIGRSQESGSELSKVIQLLEESLLRLRKIYNG